MRIALLLSTSIITAAQPRMSAPVAGYVFDASASSIRAIAGVPGAASAGDRIAFNDTFSTAFVHPALPLAAGTGKDGSVLVGSWSTAAQPQLRTIAPEFGAPDSVVFASSVDRALLISSGGVEMWAGLGAGGSSLAGYGVDVLGGVPQRASLSSDGTVGAVVLDSGRIVEVSESGVRPIGEGRSAVYVPLTADLAVLNGEGTLSIVRGGSATVVGRGFDADGELAAVGGFNGAIVLSGARHTVTLVAADSGQVSSINCGCNPGHAQQLPVQGILYFEDADRGGLLLDTGGGGPRIVPVPGIEARRIQ